MKISRGVGYNEPHRLFIPLDVTYCRS